MVQLPLQPFFAELPRLFFHLLVQQQRVQDEEFHLPPVLLSVQPVLFPPLRFSLLLRQLYFLQLEPQEYQESLS